MSLARRHRRGPFVVLAALLAWRGLATAAAPAAPASAYELTGHFGLGAGSRWDYVTVDPAAGRLYVAHAGRIDVMDLATHARIGAIGGLHGTHGIAIAAATGRGYISDGRGDALVAFDLKTLAVLQTVAAGRNPDAIVYEPSTRRIVAFNGKSHDATIVDAADGRVVAASLPLGGKPEFARVDEHGHVFVNIEDTAMIVEIDTRDARVVQRYSIAPCVEPTGLALDPAHRLYSVCSNHLMVISDPATHRVLARVPIGGGPDGVVVDDGYAVSANGADGTISVVGLAGGAALAPPAVVASRRGARTIDVDPRTHALYLPAPGDAGDLDVLVFSRRPR